MEHEAVRLREYKVHPALAPFIKCIWSQESDEPIFMEAPCPTSG